MKMYYLIKNENGFETIVKEGPKYIVEKEMKKLKGQQYHGFGEIKYFILQKEDWDPVCPLIPVDFS